jgi:putative nucleotidyltransferase with HDIG domain
MGDYPQAAPSDFLRAVCRKVLHAQEPLVCNDPSPLSGLPAPAGPAEEFHNCLVVPAVVLSHFNGVLVMFDKVEGPYEAEDVEVVLSVGDQAAVALENRRLQDELLAAYFSVVGVLADAVEAKDPYTHGHCEMVAQYGRWTAERLGLPEEEWSVVCFGGLLHDVGKIGVSDGVLNKVGKLLPEEWDLMRSHVRVGHDLLARVPALERVADVVLHHHEHYDGKGYPEGLTGERISLASRIICVVDAYAAMITRRSYKESMTEAEARAELLRCKGSHFDPAVVDAFLSVLDNPPQKPDCPDSCGSPPDFYNPGKLEHVLRPHSAGQSARKIRTDQGSASRDRVSQKHPARSV